MGNAFKVYLSSDGFWREEDGTKYVRHSDTEFQVWNGNKRLTTEKPAQDEEEEEMEFDRDFYDTESVTVYDEGGNIYKLYLSSDGFWREEDGTKYTQLSDTEFQVWNGNKRVFTDDYDDDEEDDEEPEFDRDFYDTESETIYDEMGNEFKVYLRSEEHTSELQSRI